METEWPFVRDLSPESLKGAMWRGGSCHLSSAHQTPGTVNRKMEAWLSILVLQALSSFTLTTALSGR